MTYLFTCKCGLTVELNVATLERIAFTDARVAAALAELGWKPTKPPGMYVCERCSPSFSPAAPGVARFAL